MNLNKKDTNLDLMNIDNTFSNENELREEVIRYLNFWPYFVASVVIFLIMAFTYLRYAVYQYETNAIIEIIDEAQDSEMALPTSMTVFNRSMINLENETNILKSFSLHSEVVSQLNSNIRYFTQGNIKTRQDHPDEWFDDYEIKFKFPDNAPEFGKYEIEFVNEKGMKISQYGNNDDFVFSFDDLNTSNINHDLPFDLKINNIRNFSKRILEIGDISSMANYYRARFETVPMGNESDQLLLKIKHQNIKIANEYLNSLLNAFDLDGIKDRQLEYKRTIEFVDNRAKILEKELEVIELKKQDFKKLNNLSDIKVDADNNITQLNAYNKELFDAESQKSLASFLLSSIKENRYDYLPLNIGFENFDLNVIISEFNKIITDRNKFISDAGPNNFFAKSLDSQLDEISKNISNSLKNYLNSLEIQIEILKGKENEFEKVYGNVPENEKILRSIEREQSVKESLFLLMLQKREEAAINFAVVKPTIKVIDYAIANTKPINPNKNFIYFSALFSGLLVPYIFLYARFIFDNKIHNQDQLKKCLYDEISILGQIPFIKDDKELTGAPETRSMLSESVRIIISNLKFKLASLNRKSKSIIVTSSIKGEGKTLISFNIANLLSNSNKVILIGADLRNPQIHKIINKPKEGQGVSDLIYKNDIDNFKDYAIKFGNFDVVLSGTIPPNPTELLSSEIFKKLVNHLKSFYDYIIIDTAPCLLVSDTFEISKFIDSTIYVFRANYTDKKLTDFINDNSSQKKLTNLSVVMNGVGNSASYGYKYAYQYGYQYGYKYGYEYGYKYGYQNQD